MGQKGVGTQAGPPGEMALTGVGGLPTTPASSPLPPLTPPAAWVARWARCALLTL